MVSNLVLVMTPNVGEDSFASFDLTTLKLTPFAAVLGRPENIEVVQPYSRDQVGLINSNSNWYYFKIPRIFTFC